MKNDFFSNQLPCCFCAPFLHHKKYLSVEKMPQKSEGLKWSSNCDGRKFLLNQFKRFHLAEGREGINPDLQRKEDILNIWRTNPHVRVYKENRFCTNFRDTANAYKIDRTKTGARKQGELEKINLIFIYHIVLM